MTSWSQDPLVRGRLFSPREMLERSDVVIVNDSLARRYFPGEDPLGKKLLIDMTDPVVATTIVGVVGDVRHVDLVTEPRPMTYWPHPQLTYSAMTLTLRTSGDPLALSSLGRHEIQALERRRRIRWRPRGASSAPGRPTAPRPARLTAPDDLVY